MGQTRENGQAGRGDGTEEARFVGIAERDRTGEVRGGRRGGEGGVQAGETMYASQLCVCVQEVIWG